MYTFRRHFELAALSDLDLLDRLVSGALGEVLNLVHDLVTFQDLAEYDVLAIEPAGDDGGDEELATVGVLSGVGHAEKTLASVLQLEVLIGELVAVDRLSACAVACSEVAWR